LKLTYLEDSYRQEIATTVEEVSLIGRRTALIVSELIFHPKGGGQPADSGSVIIASVPYPVRNLLKQKGRVIIVLNAKVPEHANLPGAQVTCTVDWTRRHLAMRYHTASHVMMGGVRKLLEDHYDPEGVEISDDLKRCELFFATDRDLTDDLVHRTFADAQQAISNDLNVTAREYPSLDDARTANGTLFRVASDLSFNGPVRVLLIDGWDANPCGGTHVRRLGEIGRLKPVGSTAESITFSLE
jgi:Ser-tRNA(Ala) deacylase AlaX